jgi:hypothetical protein
MQRRVKATTKKPRKQSAVAQEYQEQVEVITVLEVLCLVRLEARLDKNGRIQERFQVMADHALALALGLLVFIGI